MKFDIKELDQLVEDKYLIKQKHPVCDLWIYNYSQKTQYDRYWNDTTLQCRGLVLDSQGNKIASSFPKFFNIEELEDKDIPNESFEVFDKLDGSLILLFNYNDEWIFSSRGSFTSDQAIWAKEIFEEKYTLEHCITGWKDDPTLSAKNYCFIFELIIPQNRVVVDYGNTRELVLLSAFRKHIEVDYTTTVALAGLMGCDFVKYFDLNDTNTLKDHISDDVEGFVIRFKNGFRMKIKGDEYLRLHRIVTQVSSKIIWEYLRDDLPFDELLDRVPDEFYNWVKDTLDDLKLRYANIYFDSNKIYGEIIKTIPIRDTINHRKAFSDQATGYKNMFGLLFAIYDGKEDIIRKIIFEKIKPKFERPFSNKIIENKH